MATRSDVYGAIDSERNYQDHQAGNALGHESAHRTGYTRTLGEFILVMEECLAQARNAWYKPDGDKTAPELIRKVVGVGVAAMEQHGAPRRQGF